MWGMTVAMPYISCGKLRTDIIKLNFFMLHAEVKNIAKERKV